MTRALDRLAGAFGADRSGMGAVEFALIAPLLIVLYVGCVDVTRGITFYWKMQHATTAVNDLVSHAETLTKDVVASNFTAADKILAQYRGNELNIKVTSIKIDADGAATTLWSVTRGIAAGAPGKPFIVPDEMKSLRDVTIIVTETSVDYQPLMKSVLRTSIPMSAAARGRFRGRKDVVCSNCTS